MAKLRQLAEVDVEIWSDGACFPNPGPGGWGVVIKDGDDTQELSGAEPETTNNRMELMAAIDISA